MVDWQQIKLEYITTNISYRRLEDKYGINYKVIADKGKAEGWGTLRSQHNHNVLTSAVEAAEDSKVDRLTKLLGISDTLVDKVRERIEAINAIEVNIREMRQLAATLKDIRDVQQVQQDDADNGEYGIVMMPPTAPMPEHPEDSDG